MKINIQIEAEDKDIPRLYEILAGLGRPDEETRHPPEEVAHPPEDEVPRKLPAPVAVDVAKLEAEAEKLYRVSNSQSGSHRIDRDKLVELKWKVVDKLWDVFCTPAVIDLLGACNRRTLLELAYHKLSATNLWQGLHIRRKRLNNVINPGTLKVFEGSLCSLNRQYRNAIMREITHGRAVD